MANPSSLIHLPTVATRLSNDGQSSAAAAPSVVTVTMQPQPSAPSNGAPSDGGLRKISTILPAFLIGFVCFLAIFLACGMFHSRRRRRLLLMQSFAPGDPLDDVHRNGSRRTKKKKRLIRRPKLFEVEVKGSQWDTDLEALLPVAAELPAGSGTSKPPSPLVVVPQAQTHKPWYLPSFSFGHAPQPPTPTDLPVEAKTPVMQHAQIAFLVSMPAPHRTPGQPAPELVLGTTRVPYRGEQDGDDEAEDLLRKLDLTT